MQRLAKGMSDGSLDWMPCYPQTNRHFLDEPKVEAPREGEDDDDNDSDGLGKDSYFAIDIDTWEHQGERDKNSTLLAEQEAELERFTPLVAEELHK